MKIIMLAMTIMMMSALSADLDNVMMPERDEINTIARANRDHQLVQGYTVRYSWSKRPSIGTTILVLKVFDQNGVQTQDLAISAVASMPSMSCCTAEGENFFHNNRNGDYVTPVNFTMLGEGEIMLTFFKDDQIIDYAYIMHNLR